MPTQFTWYGLDWDLAQFIMAVTRIKGLARDLMSKKG